MSTYCWDEDFSGSKQPFGGTIPNKLIEDLKNKFSETITISSSASASDVATAIAASYGKTLVFQPGTYTANPLTITGTCHWVGAGPRESVIIKLANGANDHLLKPGDYRFRAERITFDGNSANQSAGNYDVINLADGSGYQNSVLLTDCTIQNGKRHCLYVGVARNFGRLERCTIKTCGTNGIHMLGADWEMINPSISFAGQYGMYFAGSELFMAGGDIFNCTKNAVYVYGPTARGLVSIGMVYNRNYEHGFYIDNASGSPSDPCGVQIIGGSFFDNSFGSFDTNGDDVVDNATADPGFSDIYINDKTRISIVGVEFKSYGRKVKYNVQVNGSSVNYIECHGFTSDVNATTVGSGTWASPSANFTNATSAVLSFNAEKMQFPSASGRQPVVICGAGTVGFLVRQSADSVARCSLLGSGTITFGGSGSATAPIITTNAGSPESSVTAVVGSLCSDTTNGKLYFKASGTSNTGWVVAGTQT